MRMEKRLGWETRTGTGPGGREEEGSWGKSVSRLLTKTVGRDVGEVAHLLETASHVRRVKRTREGGGGRWETADGDARELLLQETRLLLAFRTGLSQIDWRVRGGSKGVVE